MNEFEIDLPVETALTVDVTDKSLYNYDFNTYSLVSLQLTAALSVSDRIKKSLYSNVSLANMIEKTASKNEVEYVAKLSEFAKGKLNSGEWTLGIRKKTGETYAVIKDTVSGKNQSFVTLDKKTINDLGTLPELSAIQGQLATITEQIENLNHIVERVEQGQYNDRYAGFFSARQLVVEGLAATDEKVKKDLLIAAIKTTNDTIAKLMFSIHQDSLEFIDMNTKKKDAQRIDNLLQNSIGYLNSSVQLNIVAYTALGEERSLMATLSNYHSFIDQTLLKEIKDSGKSVGWKIDNAHKGNDGKFVELTDNVSNKISQLIENMKIGDIGVVNYGEIASEDLHDA